MARPLSATQGYIRCCAGNLFDVGGETLTLVLHGRTAVRPDDVIGLRIDGAKAHLFDEGSGARIV